MTTKTATIDFKTDEEMIEHREANAMALLLSAAGHAKSVFNERLPDEECSAEIVLDGDYSPGLRAYRAGKGDAVQIQQSTGGRWEGLNYGPQPQRIRNLSLLSALVCKVIHRYSKPKPAPAAPTHEVATIRANDVYWRWILVPLLGGMVFRQPGEDRSYACLKDAETAAKAAARHLGVTVA